MRPACWRESVTTFEPGARLVFTHGCDLRPFSTAFFATRPAAIITDGFDVLVQLVIAAVTTDAWRSLQCTPAGWRSTWVRCRGGVSAAVATCPPAASQGPEFTAGAIGDEGLTRAGSASWKFRGRSRSDTRSCGRRGPARLGSTVERSSERVSEYTGSVVVPEWNRPCSFMYASTSCTCSFGRPVHSRQRRVS